MAASPTTPHKGWRARLRIGKHLRAAGLLLVLAALGISGLLETAVTRGPVGYVQDDVVLYLARSEQTAVEAFAAARTINAAVSVLKSADLSAVVAQVAPMEVLEPVDDLAKQFSDVMVVSIVAILVERLVLVVSQAWALTVLLPIGCALLALSVLSRSSPLMRRRLSALGRGIIILALFARFVVLAAGWAGDGLTRRFLAHDLTTSIGAVTASSGRLNQITATAVPATAQPPAQTPPQLPGQTGAPAQSMLDQLKGEVARGLQSASNTTQAVIGKSEAMVNAARAWVPDPAAINAMVVGLPDQIVKAMEIFLVQTILTPLLVALFFYAVLRGIMRPIS